MVERQSAFPGHLYAGYTSCHQYIWKGSILRIAKNSTCQLYHLYSSTKLTLSQPGRSWKNKHPYAQTVNNRIKTHGEHDAGWSSTTTSVFHTILLPTQSQAKRPSINLPPLYRPRQATKYWVGTQSTSWWWGTRGDEFPVARSTLYCIVILECR